MADRFPSIDELDGDASAISTSTPALDDGTNELSFLDREKAILPEGTFGDVDDGEYEENKFEQEFPDILVPGPNTSVGGTIMDNVGPYVPGAGLNNSTTLPTNVAAFDDFEDGPEPEIIKEWRRRRDEGIAHRDATSEEKKTKATEEAKKAIDDFYTNYNVTKERNIKKTRTDAEKFLETREDTTAGGTSWDRIAKLVDLTGGRAGGAGADSGKGKARFRDLLKDLTKDPNAPGASGV